MGEACLACCDVQISGFTSYCTRLDPKTCALVRPVAHIHRIKAFSVWPDRLGQVEPRGKEPKQPATWVRCFRPGWHGVHDPMRVQGVVLKVRMFDDCLFCQKPPVLKDVYRDIQTIYIYIYKSPKITMIGCNPPYFVQLRSRRAAIRQKLGMQFQESTVPSL